MALYLNSCHHNGYMMEAGQNEGSHGAAISHMLNDGIHWFAVVGIHKVPGVFQVPHNLADVLGGGSFRPFPHASRLGCVLQLDQLLLALTEKINTGFRDEQNMLS